MTAAALGQDPGCAGWLLPAPAPLLALPAGCAHVYSAVLFPSPLHSYVGPSPGRVPHTPTSWTDYTRDSTRDALVSGSYSPSVSGPGRGLFPLRALQEQHRGLLRWVFQVSWQGPGAQYAALQPGVSGAPWWRALPVQPPAQRMPGGC